jgi:hypothetical protein
MGVQPKCTSIHESHPTRRKMKNTNLETQEILTIYGPYKFNQLIFFFFLTFNQLIKSLISTESRCCNNFHMDAYTSHDQS